MDDGYLSRPMINTSPQEETKKDKIVTERRRNGHRSVHVYFLEF